MSEPPSRDILDRAIPREFGNRTKGDSGRLIAIVVGIDHYEDPVIPDLTCAVNDAESISDAIRRTQPENSLESIVFTAPTREEKAGQPTRQAILDAARKAAELARPEDTVLFYFAGHGGMFQRRPSLFPTDARLVAHQTDASLERAITVDELQGLFEECPCTRRVMFLDCCQSSFSPDDSNDSSSDWQSPEPSSQGRALPWRTGMPLAENLVDAFQQSAGGWALMLACGPGEVSLEDPEWGGHGIFSHFLATGLRGEGDLDDDGIVSLPELLQYIAARVPQQAEAIIEEVRQRGNSAPAQSRQNPTMIWSGPITFPLTRRVHERRVGWHPGVLRLWLYFLFRPLPYSLAVEPMARYGTGLLYGLAMGLTVGLFAFRGGTESLTATALVVGTASGILWLSNFALAGAANEMRWHSGGYVAPISTAVWHLLVFLACASLSTASQVGDGQSVFQFGTGLLIIYILMLIFAHNELQGIIALADLVKRDLRVAGRRAFVQLERQWIHADIDNTIAMVSAHPKLYLAVAAVATILILIHVTHVLLAVSEYNRATFHLARDFVLLVLVHWQTQWYAAAYRKLRGILLPER